MRALLVRKIPTFAFGLLALLTAPTGSRAGITQILDSTGDGTHLSLSPRPIVVDPDRNVYVASVLTDNAFRISPTGSITQIIDATGDGQGSPLVNPRGIALDPAGNIYITGRDSHNAFKITPEGTITEIINASGDGQGNWLGQASAIAVDAVGNVYVSGRTSHNVFRITAAGAQPLQIRGPLAVNGNFAFHPSALQAVG